MLNNIIVKYYKSRFGELIIGDYNGSICLCDWRYRKQRLTIDNRIKKYLNSEFISGSTPLIESCIKQLKEYFNYKRKVFSLPFKFAGSPFQIVVWKYLLEIPFGSVTTYKKQAEKIGKPSAVRAIANANGANAISIIVPCHRVIGSNGKLTGYAGGIDTKKKLLELEQDLFIEEEK